MNCPVCGKEMEQGKLLACGSRGLYFLPPDGDADALILTKKYITGQNGIVLTAGTIRRGLPSAKRSSPPPSAARAGR
mgnify:CR=1 FL=1